VLVPLRQPVLLQAILAGIFACLAVAYLRLVRSERSVFGRADRWLVALPMGLLFGWITAANVVSFNDTLVETGLLGSGRGGALVGACLLLAGAAVACVVIRVSKAGPLQGLLAYTAAVLWALVGVVVTQYDAIAAHHRRGANLCCPRRDGRRQHAAQRTNTYRTWLERTTSSVRRRRLIVF
jgi:hypothetical protein